MDRNFIRTEGQHVIRKIQKDGTSFLIWEARFLRFDFSTITNQGDSIVLRIVDGARLIETAPTLMDNDDRTAGVTCAIIFFFLGLRFTVSAVQIRYYQDTWFQAHPEYLEYDMSFLPTLVRYLFRRDPSVRDLMPNSLKMPMDDIIRVDIVRNGLVTKHLK